MWVWFYGWWLVREREWVSDGGKRRSEGRAWDFDALKSEGKNGVGGETVGWSNCLSGPLRKIHTYLSHYVDCALFCWISPTIFIVSPSIPHVNSTVLALEWDLISPNQLLFPFCFHVKRWRSRNDSRRILVVWNYEWLILIANVISLYIQSKKKYNQRLFKLRLGSLSYFILWAQCHLNYRW